MWFDFTSEGKGERYTSPYASTHHIIFSLPWMGPSHRQPPFLSDSRSQNLSQHIFYTMLRKTLSGFCTKQNPGGGLSVRACRVSERESKERQRGRLLFSEIQKSIVLPSVLHVVERSFLVFSKTSFTFVSPALLCSVEYYRNPCPSVSDGDQSFWKN